MIYTIFFYFNSSFGTFFSRIRIRIFFGSDPEFLADPDPDSKKYSHPDPEKKPGSETPVDTRTRLLFFACLKGAAGAPALGSDQKKIGCKSSGSGSTTLLTRSITVKKRY